MESDSKSLGLVAFAWIIVGTAGFLADEFLFDLGSNATLASAAVSLVGLTALGYSLLRDARPSHR